MFQNRLVCSLDSVRCKPKPPMWRNGRRNGLKIRSRENGVWVRIPSSAPLKSAFYEAKSKKRLVPPVSQVRASKRMDYASIRQVLPSEIREITGDLFQCRP